MMDYLSDKALMLLLIIGLLIGAMVGVIGMMIMYSIFPDVFLAEPNCDCPSIKENYSISRSLFAVLGWFFSLIPITITKLYVDRKLAKEEKYV